MWLVQEKESWDMDTAEKLVATASKKDEGNNLFKCGKYARAAKKYDKVAKLTLSRLVDIRSKSRESAINSPCGRSIIYTASFRGSKQRQERINENELDMWWHLRVKHILLKIVMFQLGNKVRVCRVT